MMDNLENIKIQVPDRRWQVNSNVLMNYMMKFEFMQNILDKQAICPRYVPEDVSYLGLPGRRVMVFPMTCFCDMPIRRVGYHVKKYGSFGIGLDKEACLKKGIQPVTYLNTESSLGKSYMEALRKNYHSKERVAKDQEYLVDQLLETLLYLKPIWGYMKLAMGEGDWNFHDEHEWRFVPAVETLEDLPLILPPQYSGEIDRNRYSRIIALNPGLWLHFDWEEIRYLIVPDEEYRKILIRDIRGRRLDQEVQDHLISRIEVLKQWEEDL